MATTVTPFVTWNDSWLVGVREIDAQHKNLVSILNQLHEAAMQGHGNDVLGKILDSLVRYTTAHFAAEERLIEQH
ncbi:MAG: hemerythrin domain-containing protein, partial [Bryobacteraceae bacterium]